MNRYLSSLAALAIAFAFPAFAAAQVSSTPSSTPVPADSTPITLSIPSDLTGTAGSTVVVPLQVSEGKGISDFALSIVFDPAKLTYVKVEPSASTVGFEFIDNAIDGENGMKELILGGNTTNAITASGEADLALITFSIAPGAAGSTSFSLKNPINDIEKATLENGTLTIAAAAVSTAPPVSTVPPATEIPSTMAPASTIVSTEPSSITIIATNLDATGPAESLLLLGVASGLGALLNFRRRKV